MNNILFVILAALIICAVLLMGTKKKSYRKVNAVVLAIAGILAAATGISLLPASMWRSIGIGATCVGVGLLAAGLLVWHRHQGMRQETHRHNQHLK